MLEAFGKTFERLINYRLRLHLEINNFLSPGQFGFRQHRSTEDALNVITGYLKTTKFPDRCALVTKDVKQAFDTVWHTGLKHKICNNFELPHPTQRLLCNFLTDRKIRVRHQQILSDHFTPLAGVPQGSVLSPTLYNMFTHDIPNTKHQLSLTLQYADDVTQLTRARSLDTLTTRIQTELSETSLWELKWRIQSHPDKTSVTYFNIKTERPRQIYLFPFLPAQPPIPRTKNTKILGLIIDDRTAFHKQITQKKGIALTTLSNVQRFRNCSAETKSTFLRH